MTGGERGDQNIKRGEVGVRSSPLSLSCGVIIGGVMCKGVSRSSGAILMSRRRLRRRHRSHRRPASESSTACNMCSSSSSPLGVCGVECSHVFTCVQSLRKSVSSGSHGLSVNVGVHRARRACTPTLHCSSGPHAQDQLPKCTIVVCTCR